MGSLGRLPLRIALIDEMAMQAGIMRTILILSLAMVPGMRMSLIAAAWLPVSLAVILVVGRSGVTRIIQQNHNPFFNSLWCRQT